MKKFEEGIPGAIFLDLNVNASDYPNEFPKTHLMGCTKATPGKARAGDMVQRGLLHYSSLHVH